MALVIIVLHYCCISCFSVICVSCYKLHKIKLAENMTLLQGQRPEESNQQEDEPYRWYNATWSYK